MAKYAITNGSTSGAGTQQNMTAAYSGSLIGLTGGNAAPRRGKIYDVMLGTNGIPADNFIEWDISRVTTNSTATVATPQPLDVADAAALTTTTVNSSTFGTITSNSNVFYFGINQRASYRWVASPGGELIWPATSSAGFQLRARSGGYTGTATATLHFEEQ